MSYPTDDDRSAGLAPKDDRKVTAALELGTGELISHWIAGGKLSLSFERNYQRRSRRFVDRTLEFADTDEDRLVDRVSADERFADVVAAAGRKAISTSDEPMQDWLARLVAAAFLDDARVDEVAFLVHLLTQMEPVHLRVLQVLPDQVSAEGELAAISTRVDLEPGLTLAALAHLEAVGVGEDHTPGGGRPKDQHSWWITRAGQALLKYAQDAAARLRRPVTGLRFAWRTA
jgi:hypothetical protein